MQPKTNIIVSADTGLRRSRKMKKNTINPWHVGKKKKRKNTTATTRTHTKKKWAAYLAALWPWEFVRVCTNSGLSVPDIAKQPQNIPEPVVCLLHWCIQIRKHTHTHTTSHLFQRHSPESSVIPKAKINLWGLISRSDLKFQSGFVMIFFNEIFEEAKFLQSRSWLYVLQGEYR